MTGPREPSGQVLVTGGSGFIGSALVERLLARHHVTVLDNGRRRSPRFAALAGHPRLTVIEGDVTDTAAVQAATKGATWIVHAAAIAGVSSYYRQPLRTMEVNLLGTRNLLEAARAVVGLERFVLLSTSEVFGPRAWRAREDGPTAQGDAADRRWTYAVSKLAAERYALCYHWETGLPVVSVRPFNIYGPGQVGEGALQVFARRALGGQPIEVTGDGLQVRSWCYIDDMVRAIELALQEPGAVGRVYNIGNPRATCTILDLAERVRRLAGSASPVRFVPHPGSDIELRVPDVARARAELGWEPGIDLDDGIRRSLAWYRLHPDAEDFRAPRKEGADGR